MQLIQLLNRYCSIWYMYFKDGNVYLYFSNTYILYRIMAALKVEKDLITSFAVSQIGQAVIMYAENFKNVIISFTGIKCHNVMLHWVIFSRIRVIPLILTISLHEIKGKMSDLPINYEYWFWNLYQYLNNFPKKSLINHKLVLNLLVLAIRNFNVSTTIFFLNTMHSLSKIQE